MSSSWKFLPVFILAIVLLSACQTTPALAPTATSELNMVVPTPKPGSAVITGQVIDAKTGLPPKTSVYLAKNLTADKPELPPLVSFSLQQSPRAMYDETTGNFIFTDIPPSLYVVAFWIPPNQMEYKKINDQGAPLMVTAEGGKTLNLGVIKYP